MALSFSSVASTSTRGNRFSPLLTCASAGSTPHTLALSQVRAASSAPILAKILPQLSGITGCNSAVQTRMVSSRLYSTVARRTRLLSSLPSVHGAVSSIYLLARSMTLKISSRLFWSWSFSISASYRSRRAHTVFFRSQSSGESSRSAGSLPPKYFSTMPVVRLTRFPSLLARSVLMVEISSSLEKLPSEPKGKVRSRKKRSASTPNSSAST